MRAWFLIALVAVPSLAVAAPIELSTKVTISNSSFLTNGESCADTGTATAHCHLDVPFPDPFAFPPAGPAVGISVQDANATAAFGNLAIDVTEIPFSATFTGGPGDYALFGSASFADELTVVGGFGDGFIQYEFSSLITHATNIIASFITYTHDDAAPFLINAFGTTTHTSPLLPFDFGTPFGFVVYAQGLTVASALEVGGFAHTHVTLEGFNVFDANGQPVSNYSIRSAAGADYAVTAIPEPSTVLLIGGGLVLAVRGRRQASTLRVRS